MRALVLAALLLSTARAEPRELCTPGTKYRGQTRDFDVKDADLRDVFRLLADTADLNIVVADDVTGRVTMRLRRVPWDQILCTVAQVHKLRVTIDNRIVMVTRRAR